MERKIDLGNIVYNVKKLKRMTTAKFCAVVKCNAYGLGAVKVAQAIYDEVDCFAVANAYEAEQLVSAGIDKEIIVLSSFYDGRNFPQNVIFTAYNMDSANTLINSSRRFAVKVNTGMNRLGFSPDECNRIIKTIPQYKIHSIFSHFSSLKRAYEQLLQFNKVKTTALKHICASNFTELSQEYHLNMVRCGMALYGVGVNGLRQVLSVTGRIINLNTVKCGGYIGYGDYCVDYDVTVATVDVGYGDGLKRIPDYSTCFLYYNDIPCKILGQVCMDSCMIAIPIGIEAKIGDEIEVIGENNTAEKLAKALNTIPYEVLTSFSQARGDLIYIK